MIARQGECNGCGQPIKWVKLAPRFKPHPVDPQPNVRGTIHVDDRGCATIIPNDHLTQARAAGAALHVSHFATCPDAARMRRPNTPIPEPATPVRTLVLEPQTTRLKDQLTEGQVLFMEAQADAEHRAARAQHLQRSPQMSVSTLATGPAPGEAPAAPCARCVDLALELKEANGRIDWYKAGEQQIGGEWLRELRALRAELSGGSAAHIAGRDALRELALRMGYRLKA